MPSLRSTQASFVPVKYGSSTRPVSSRTRASWGRNSSHIAAVRRSCHTMARRTGRPVDGSHTTSVSRWLVIPIAAIDPSRRRDDFGQRGPHGVEDLVRVVFDPAGFGEVLREFAVGDVDGFAGFVDDESPYARGPRVDRKYVAHTGRNPTPRCAPPGR